ncbi:MAG: PD-(D/E)XK nuclease family protein [Anaerococcus sp.]|nr:PD-(D/E)XK nuclease family protein [Anaerococcus sp.]
MIRNIISRFPRENSKHIYKLIEKDLREGRKAILLVPEQYTLQTDINLMDNISSKTVIDAKVLSYSSLRSFILGKIGLDQGDFLSKNGKIMVLTRVLQDLDKDLNLFSNKSSNIDFIQNIGSLISSIKDNVFDQDFFDRIRENADDLTRIKFEELKLIYDKYQDMIRDKFVDGEDGISFMVGKIDQCDFLEGVNFYFDKFESLSDLKLSLVDALVKRGNEVTFSLSLDRAYLNANRFSDKEYFDSAINLYSKLNMIENTENVFLKEDPKLGPDLRHLANNFERFTYDKYQGQVKNIKFIENPTTKNEVYTLAIVINKLIKKQGFRYKDIGIYVSDEEEYTNQVSKVFNSFNLPIYMDRQRKLADNHISKSFLALLRLITYKFRQEDLSYFLRSSIFTYGNDFDEKVLVFQNFIANRKIRGDMVLDDKYFTLDYEFYENLYKDDRQKSYKLQEKLREYELINDLRDKLLDLISPLLALEEIKVSHLLMKIYQVLSNDSIKNGIRSYQRILEAMGRLDDYKENDQVWDKFIGILEEINKLMGDRTLSLKEIYILIETAAKDINIGIIPPTKDHIIVTSFKRARIEDKKINFVLGLNDAFFPSKANHDLIISKENIESLKDFDIDFKALDEDFEEREKLNLYKIITSSQRLYLSYSLSDKDGEVINKSIVLDGIMSIFSDKDGKIPRENMIYGSSLEFSDLKFSYEKVKEYSLGILRSLIKDTRVGDMDKQRAKAFMTYLESRGEDTMIKKGLYYTNNKENLREPLNLFGKDYFNVSELETYARCPYKHFVSFGLRPKFEDSYQVDNLEVGNIIHKIFEEISKSIKDIDDLKSEDVEAILIEKFNQAISENLDKTRKADPKNKFILNNILNSSKRNTGKLVGQIRDGDFKIYGLEEDFGYEDSLLPKVYVDKDNYLRGRIDRIDKAGSYVRIIDYKSGDKKFKIVNLLNGLDLQLLVYMMALRDNKKEVMVPIGSFYMPLADEIKSIKDSYSAESIKESLKDRFRLNGLIVDIDKGVFDLLDSKHRDDIENSPLIDMKNSDLLSEKDLGLLEQFAKDLVSKYIGEIKGGEINLRPLAYDENRNECQYCDFKGICKFDLTIDQLRYRIFDKTLSLDELKIGRKDDDGLN